MVKLLHGMQAHQTLELLEPLYLQVVLQLQTILRLVDLHWFLIEIDTYFTLEQRQL